jgi:hypothetical protein
MTIEAVRQVVFERLAPRGSLIRFGIAGAFNSSIFFVGWTVTMVLFTSVDVRVLWGIAWGVTGVLAHFVHRAFTFDDHMPLSWTLPTAVPVYIGSLVGSSLSLGWLDEAFPKAIHWMGVVNMLVWGLMIWATMRLVVFRFSPPTTHGSQESQGE